MRSLPPDRFRGTDRVSPVPVSAVTNSMAVVIASAVPSSIAPELTARRTIWRHSRASTSIEPTG